MRVLLTGADGYIGSVAGPILIARGHDVVGLDTGYYREGYFGNGADRRAFPIIAKDIRHVEVQDLAGYGAVIHLAELSNDPLAELNSENTFRINHAGSVSLAETAREAGVRRFIYASSCSVYGAGFDDVKSEASEVNPLTAYAECKVRVERDVGALASENFSPTFLRNATVFGVSPRMRFDLVVNNLSGWAWTTGEIRMTSDGTPWRPLVHVRDVAEAMACALEAPREAVHGQILNVGTNSENLRVREVAQLVSDTFPGCRLSIGSSDGDDRSYRVAFDKIVDRLPAFRPSRTVEDGARELLDAFESIGMTPETFEARPFTRLRQLRHLLETGQLDDELFWRSS